MKKVNEIVTSENSLFSALRTKGTIWFEDLFFNTTPEALDMMLLVKCGERYCSPLLSHYQMKDVATYIYNKYGESWSKIRTTLDLDYDVLSPYKVTTETVVDKTVSNTNESESRQENGVVGFDSETATPSTIDTNADSNTANATESGTTKVTTNGNNGNAKYTDLITNEIEVRKTSFIELVLNDIQSQITLDIY